MSVQVREIIPTGRIGYRIYPTEVVLEAARKVYDRVEVRSDGTLIGTRTLTNREERKLRTKGLLR